jgi:RNA polymerase sigma factor (sigma-70 family)
LDRRAGISPKKLVSGAVLNIREEPDTHVTDRELLERYLEGHVEAFEEILGRYERPLLRFVARYLTGFGRDGAAERAEDAVQEVFLRFVREARNLRSVENLSAWLYRVARNIAIDERRKETRMERRHQMKAEPEAAAPPILEEERREVAGIVTAKLHGLPPNQRDVLILKIQEGKSYLEISEITGLTPSNIGYLIHHGLKNLARDLRTAGIV